MKPIRFKEQTGILFKPHDMTEEECGPLPIYHDGQVYVSCWKMNFKERIMALIFGRVWLRVRGKISQPPVSLGCEKTAFTFRRETK